MKKSTKQIIWKYGSDILQSQGMNEEKQYIQHGKISVYKHSIDVTALSIEIVRNLGIKVNMRALVRGALLHDYFLYDWHIPDKSHRLHGFSHAKCAFKNANRDFPLDRLEMDMIKSHMFPLNLTPPKHKESMILWIADKICATRETFSGICCKIK